MSGNFGSRIAIANAPPAELSVPFKGPIDFSSERHIFTRAVHRDYVTSHFFFDRRVISRWHAAYLIDFKKKKNRAKESRLKDLFDNQVNGSLLLPVLS